VTSDRSRSWIGRRAVCGIVTFYAGDNVQGVYVPGVRAGLPNAAI
jgi:tRNA-binding EMAP/Myf-like protein